MECNAVLSAAPARMATRRSAVRAQAREHLKADLDTIKASAALHARARATLAVLVVLQLDVVLCCHSLCITYTGYARLGMLTGLLAVATCPMPCTLPWPAERVPALRQVRRGD
jgi:hypothetical protein